MTEADAESVVALSEDGPQYEFYVYDDDRDDPRFSFWLQTDSLGGMALYDRPPEGPGMWLDPNPGGDYDPVVPTAAFERAVAKLLADGVDEVEVEDLPAHEAFFIAVVHGTAEDDPDKLPEPIWAYLNRCRERWSDAE